MISSIDYLLDKMDKERAAEPYELAKDLFQALAEIEKLKNNLKKATDALKHYANEKYYDGGRFTVDGDIANKALAEIEGKAK